MSAGCAWNRSAQPSVYPLFFNTLDWQLHDMRQAGTVATKSDAERFANYLIAQGISAKLEAVADGYAVWIHDENQLARSKQELEAFQLKPGDEKYAAAETTARQVRRAEAEKVRQAQRNFIDMRNEWAKPWRRRPVTIALMAISVIAYQIDPEQFYFLLPEIKQGEIWRLVTPIFLHFGFLHIAFNMYMLYQLGSIVERKIGSVLYVLLVLAIAIPSNVAQFNATGPGFGGMSGVVYGLFGYAWVRGRLDPTSGLYLRSEFAFWMIAWFALCAFGYIEHVANWAHGVGLVVGALLGTLPELNLRMRRRR